MILTQSYGNLGLKLVKTGPDAIPTSLMIMVM
jgi:hypothetical protein